MATRQATWVLLLLASGCSCGEPMSGVCRTDAMCASDEVCVDGTCRGRSDGGPEMDAGPLADGGPVPDAGPRPDVGPPEDSGADLPDAICGGQSIEIDYRPPNVLLIFDRSCSMRRTLTDGEFGAGPEDPTTRWNTAREAALGLIDDFGNRAFWGLMAYPDPREGCGDPVDAEVPPGANTRDAIAAALVSDEIQPFGLCGPDNSDSTTQPRQTPTYDAMTSAQALPALSDPTRASFAIVITDGGVSCSVSDASLMQLAGEMAAAGIPVGVIGFTTSGSETSLEAIASAGGLANPAGPPSYFVAEDRAALDAVLDEIAARVVSCELALSVPPTDPGRLFVITNDGELPMDATDGWTYDATANRITLHGASCEALRRGGITRLDVGEGCAPMECVPQDETCNGLDDDCDDAVDEACLG